MPTAPMVRVTTVGDPIEAKIIAARLGSEGVVWELRGGVDGPYPMGPFHVYVARDDLAVAQDVLALAAEEREPELEATGRATLALWLIVLSVVAVAVFAVVRMAAGSGVCHDDPAAGLRCADPATTTP